MTGISTMFVVLAALCWGLSGGIGGMLVAEGWDPTVVSFYRGAIGLFFVMIWLGLRQRRSGLTKVRVWLWSIIAGLGVAGNFTFYFISISEGSIAVAATLMYCAPVFVYLISFALKLEEPNAGKWISIIMVMVGIVMLTRIYNIDAGGVTLVGIATGLLSGLSYALFIFGFKYAGPYGSPQAILVIAFAVLTGILVVLGDTAQIVGVPKSHSWPLFAILGLIGGGLSFIIYIVGLRNTAPAVASVVAMIEPVTASLFGVVVFQERLGGLQIFGMILILITVTGLSVSSRIQKIWWRRRRIKPLVRKSI